MMNPDARAAANKRTDAIAGNFPAGVSRPALRALDGAGYTKLEQLRSVSDEELLALHGMGPKALKILREALRSRR